MNDMHNELIQDFNNGPTKWSKLLETSEDVELFRHFTLGNASGRELRRKYGGTKKGGKVRNLLFYNGVDHSRELCRRALRYRKAL